MTALSLATGRGDEPPVDGVLRVYENLAYADLDYETITAMPPDRELRMDVAKGIGGGYAISLSIDGVFYDVGDDYPYEIWTSDNDTFESGWRWPCRFEFP